MRLENYPPEKLKKEILEICAKHLDLSKYKAFFFGSRVKGDNFPRSDIDIGILGPETVPSRAIIEIKEEIEELPILYKIDVIDFTETSERFREVALKNVEFLSSIK